MFYCLQISDFFFFFPGSKIWSLTVCAFEFTCAQGPCNVLTIEPEMMCNVSKRSSNRTQ